MHTVISKLAHSRRAATLVAPAATRASLPSDRNRPLVEVVVQGHFSKAGTGSLQGSDEAQLLGELFLERGEHAFSMVDGAFSFMLVDNRSGRTYAGIDKVGKAETFVADLADRVVIATSINEVIESAGQTLNVDLESIHDFLSLGWVPNPHSMFVGVSKLPPGSYIIWDGKVITSLVYYRPSHSPAFTERTSAQLSNQIRDHLHTSVRRGVPWSDSWAAFLSGGLDSSGVIYSLATCTDHSFPTYYGAFGDLTRYMALPDEARIAQAVASAFGTDHHIVSIGEGALESVPGLVQAIQEPLSDGGPVVIDQVMRAAKLESTGIMTGVGGDFLFGGERRHLLISLLTGARRLPVWGVARRLADIPTGWSEWLTRARFDVQRAASIRELSLGEFNARRLHGGGVVDRLFRPVVLEALNRTPIDEINACLNDVKNLDDLTALLYLDLRMLTPDSLARDVETLGRAHGMDVYHPYLDADFVDFAMTIPPRDKVRRLKMKYAMHQALRGFVPDEVLKRRKKGGLGAPIRFWVTHHPLVDEHLSPDVVKERGLFSYAEIDRMLSDTRDERRDYSTLLWGLFTLEVWMRQFADRVPNRRAPSIADATD